MKKIKLTQKGYDDIERMAEHNKDNKHSKLLAKVQITGSYTITEQTQLNQIRHWFNYFYVDGNQGGTFSKEELEKRMIADGYEKKGSGFKLKEKK